MLKGILSTLSIIIVLSFVVFVIGCENSNPVHPVDTTTMGEMKEKDGTSEDVADIGGIRLIDYGTVESVPGAPQLLEQKDEEETKAIALFEHVDSPGGDETVRFVMTEGYHVPQACNLDFTANGEDIGSLTAPKNLPWGKVLIEDGDLPSGDVVITMTITCNGEAAASATLTIFNRPATSAPSNPLLIDGGDGGDKGNDPDDDGNDPGDDDPGDGKDGDDDDDVKTLRIDDVRLGDKLDEIILEFEDDANASSSVKDNVTVSDGDLEYRIRSYDENADEITLIMRKDLPYDTEITVSYNGEGGLKGRPGGEKVEEFELSFTTPEEEDPEDTLTIGEAIATRTSILVPNGLYRAGTTFLTGLDYYKFKGFRVSDWSRQILSNPAFPVEEEEGETEVVFVTAADLGLVPGNYTAKDVILAVVTAGYSLLPEETAAQMRLLYEDQPDRQVVVTVTSPIFNPATQKNYLLMLGREDHIAEGLWLTALEISDANKVGYTLFAVGK